MSDKRGSSVVCNDTCGCASPCPGAQACRCNTSSETWSGEDHMKCSCGEHCGCNPCNCTKTEEGITRTGKRYCKCGDGCACVTCAA